MRAIEGMIGQRFGRLVVVADAPSIIEPSGRPRISYQVRCDCGATKVIRSGTLRSGSSQSCGCLTIERTKETVTKHGSSRSKEHRTWQGMKQRCTNPNGEKWPDYGQRGIRVCDRWFNSFENFLADMGLSPSPKHSIDRIDVNGNYEPGNCRWATDKEQAANRRKRRKKT